MKREPRVQWSGPRPATVLIKESVSDSTSLISFVLDRGEFTADVLKEVKEKVGYGIIPKGNPSELCLIQPRDYYAGRTKHAIRILQEILPGVPFVTYQSMASRVLGVPLVKRGS